VGGKVLITGAGGYLGRRLARRLLETTDRELILWLRGRDASDVAEKRAALEALYKPWGSRVTLAFGDLEAENPFETVEASSVGTLVHGAAIIRFNVSEEDARRTNLEGTEKLLRFADRCRNLEHLGLISSVYSSGLKSGPVEEVLFRGDDGFCNFYERSKWESEQALVSRHGHLPHSLIRLATIIADDDAGAVTQYNAVHNTLMLFHYGLLSLIPGHAETPLYFITGDFAVDAVLASLAAGPGKIHHVSHRREESISLGAFVDAAFDQFNEDEGFRSRRLLKPLYADQPTFDILVDGMKSFGGGVVNDSLSSITPFARQLFIAKDIRNDALRAVMPSYRAPDPTTLMKNVCRYLVRTKWGRLPAESA
jgi:nucleoside-diphosphate-sugar epimerase